MATSLKQSPTDKQIVNTLRAAMIGPDQVRYAAARFGYSPSYLYGIVNGNAPLTPNARERILSMVREDELALADRIAAEWGW